eukprot:COSAG01_NODE_1608_length_9744_cov_3.534266_3_plen_54_part_00
MRCVLRIGTALSSFIANTFRIYMLALTSPYRAGSIEITKLMQPEPEPEPEPLQ